jgi:hypothetical protein
MRKHDIQTKRSGTIDCSDSNARDRRLSSRLDIIAEMNNKIKRSPWCWRVRERNVVTRGGARTLQAPASERRRWI